MRHSLLSTMSLMALVPTGLTTTVEPVSLSKFTPRIENLPSSCQQAYNAPISGCTRDDFPKERNPNINNCSPACIDGLVDIVQLVNKQCSTVRVPADSIIGVALLGDLLPKLCGKIVVVTEGPASATSTLASSSQGQSQTQTAQSSRASGTEEPSSSSAASGSQSQSQGAASSTSMGLTLDTGVPPPPASSSSAPPPGETASNQEANTGGSPFDVMLFSASGERLRGTVTGMMMVAVAVGLLVAA